MDDPVTTAVPPGWYVCPGCDEAFDPIAEPQSVQGDGTLRCPYCNTRFTAPAGPAPDEPGPAGPAAAAGGEPSADGFAIEDDREDYEQATVRREVDDERELSRLRVRQLSALRRAAYRTRSYCVIGAVGCAVAAVKLVLMTSAHAHARGWGLRPVLYVLAAAAALAGVRFFFGRAAGLTRELNRPAQTDPDSPPDFSTLSDGSQHWKNLEELH